MAKNQNKKRPLGLWLLGVAMALLVTACTTELDLRELGDQSLSPSIVLPLGEANATMLDIVKDVNSAHLGYDEAGNYAYLHYFDSILFNTDSVLKNHIFTNVQDYNFEFSEAATPEIINTYPMVLPSGIPAIFEHTYNYDLGYNKVKNGVVIQRIDSMQIANARIKMVISIEGITGISPTNPLKLELQFPDVSTLSNRTFVYNITGNTFTVEESIANAILRMYQQDQKSNVRLNIKYTVKGPVTINSYYKIAHNIIFEQIEYVKAWGFFNRTEELTGDEIYTELPKEFIKQSGLWNNRLLFHNPVVDININSNVGIPLMINVHYIKATDENNQSVYADFNGSQSTSIVVPQATENQMATTNTTFNRNNGKTNRLFTINPSSVNYKFGLKVDNERVNQGGVYAKHFATLPVKTSMYVDIKLPFTFDPTSEYVHYDTIALDDRLDVVINRPEEFVLNLLHINLDCENALPVQAIADVICLDTLEQELYRREGFAIGAPKVDALGFVTEPWKGLLTLNFENGDIKNILNTKKFVIKVTAKGYDSSAMINARLTDYLKIKASLFAKGTYTVNPKKNK